VVAAEDGVAYNTLVVRGGDDARRSGLCSSSVAPCQFRGRKAPFLVSKRSARAHGQRGRGAATDHTREEGTGPHISGADAEHQEPRTEEEMHKTDAYDARASDSGRVIASASTIRGLPMHLKR